MHRDLAHSSHFYSRRLFAERSGSPGKPHLLLIHGAPGCSGDWRRVVEHPEIRSQFCTHAVDRPGFSRSRGRRLAADFPAQIAELRGFVCSQIAASERLFVVGYSYGAAVAAGLAGELARTRPIEGLGLISGTLSPHEGHRHWYHSFLLTPVLGLLAPQAYRLAASEMSGVGLWLESLAAFWPTVDFPVVLLHGTADRVVSIGNSEYAAGRIPEGRASFSRLKDAGHGLLRTRVNEVAECLVYLKQRSRVGGAI